MFLCPWRDLKATQMWHLGTWVSLGHPGVIVKLYDLRGLSEQNNSVILWGAEAVVHWPAWPAPGSQPGRV